jgi:hypothetical protein
MVLLGSIVAVCLLLFVLVFLFPRLSGRPQRGVDRSLETGRSQQSCAWKARPLAPEAVHEVGARRRQERLGRARRTIANAPAEGAASSPSG